MVTQIGLTPTKVVTQAQPSLLDQIIAFLPLVLLFVLIIVIIFFVVRWLTGKKKERKDIYVVDYKKTIEQCKINKTDEFIKPIMGLPSWIMSKGVPVIITYPAMNYSKQFVRTEENKERLLTVEPGKSYKLGSYAGHCVTKDGCYNLLVKSAKAKVLFIFPKLIVLKLRMQHKQFIPDDTNPRTGDPQALEVLPDSFSKSSDMIIINTLGIEKTGEYYYTVNMDKDGYVVDTKPYIYNDMMEIATQKQVMDLGRNMAMIAEELSRGNPLVQFLRKTDTSLTGE
jgi:hypothetical protein